MIGFKRSYPNTSLPPHFLPLTFPFSEPFVSVYGSSRLLSREPVGHGCILSVSLRPSHLVDNRWDLYGILIFTLNGLRVFIPYGVLIWFEKSKVTSIRLDTYLHSGQYFDKSSHKTRWMKVTELRFQVRFKYIVKSLILHFVDYDILITNKSNRFNIWIYIYWNTYI